MNTIDHMFYLNEYIFSQTVNGLLSTIAWAKGQINQMKKIFILKKRRETKYIEKNLIKSSNQMIHKDVLHSIHAFTNVDNLAATVIARIGFPIFVWSYKLGDITIPRFYLYHSHIHTSKYKNTKSVLYVTLNCCVHFIGFFMNCHFDAEI